MPLHTQIIAIFDPTAPSRLYCLMSVVKLLRVRGQLFSKHGVVCGKVLLYTIKAIKFAGLNLDLLKSRPSVIFDFGLAHTQRGEEKMYISRICWDFASQKAHALH